MSIRFCRRLMPCWGLLIGLAACQPPAPVYDYPFQDPAQPLDARVEDLLGRLTLAEKVEQLRYDAPAIPEWGVPAYNWWNECLHGVGRAGKATVFPQAIGMAATWDTARVYRIATAVSDEARAKHHHFAAQGRRGIYQGLTFWTPNINIFRDPRWGRGQETYGEDPYLTSRLAVNYIRGLQGDDPDYLKLVATAKHFAVHSGPERSRHRDDYHTTERDLRQTYLPAFEATVKEAHVQSVMCAYNRYRGAACCGSDLLLQTILRDEWGFDGYVVSDCWAITDFYEPDRHGLTDSPAEAAAMAVRAGTDLNCGSTFAPYLNEAVDQGLDEAVIDQALRRLLKARFQLGMFDPPAQVPWAQIPYEVVGSDAHEALSLDAARASLTLLKNENQTLPLSPEVKKVAVIGPLADDYQVLLGNYHGTPSQWTSPVAGLRAKGLEVTHAPGCEIAPGFPALRSVPASALQHGGQPGLQGQYFANPNWEGTAALTRQDSTVDFIWVEAGPIPGVPGDSLSVRWTGTLVAPQSGRYRLGLRACNAGRFFWGEDLKFEFDNIHHPLTRSFTVTLKAGQAYPLTLEMASHHTDPQARLLWAFEEADLLGPALTAARAAEVVVLCLGLSPDIEGEEMPVSLEGFDGGDRTDIQLPRPQRELLDAITALGKPTVLVLMGGSAIAVPDQNVGASLMAWYPGPHGGTAIADVLLGAYNPAGRLPVTFYQRIADLPDFGNYDMAGRTYRYFAGEVAYPFGHGLSYSRFAYGKLQVPATLKAGDDFSVTVEVTNTSERAGEEVVQLYLTDDAASEVTPLRSLVGFRRIQLEAGASQMVSFSVSARQTALITADGRSLFEPGTFTLHAGGNQPGYGPTTQAVVEMK